MTGLIFRFTKYIFPIREPKRRLKTSCSLKPRPDASSRLRDENAVKLTARDPSKGIGNRSYGTIRTLGHDASPIIHRIMYRRQERPSGTRTEKFFGLSTRITRLFDDQIDRKPLFDMIVHERCQAVRKNSGRRRRNARRHTTGNL